MRVLRETVLVFGYELQRMLRNPVYMIMGVFQPVLWLLLFVPLLDRMSPGTSNADDLRTFVPGVLTMLAILSTLLVGFTFLTSLRAGVLERLVVTPASRFSLAFGKILADVVGLLVQSAILLGIAALIGFRTGFVSAILILALMVLLGLLVASFSYALALTLRNEMSFSSIANFVTLPLILLAGMLVPLSYAPGWMKIVGRANPLRYAVDGVRSLAAGHLADSSVATGFLVLAGLTILTVTWAARGYRRIVA